ncbi:MAG: cation:proton antiporter [Candidatus Loosdrechtia sp.]|uniref:cation:proton antiporter n=1 Tax=Candidatus Loosdrechtia sp. TaxID=3101272 RepID=UPI003A70B438|nr:MAG: cation:proton antiporter [Candidatus Jettenia sp. AMX2]
MDHLHNIISVNIFYEFSFVLIIAAIIGVIARILKQPLIVAFIAVGVLIGPAGLNVEISREQLHLFAHMGISVLLFLVGLKLDIILIKSMGPVALATGLGQVFFTSALGFFIALELGFPVVSSVYIAVALTFSSTIIIVKLLSDKKEIDSLHGRIAVGFLIVQDIVVVIALIILSAFGREGEDISIASQMLLVFIKGTLFLTGLAFLMKYVIPFLIEKLARSHELLILFSIAWAISLASLCDFLGFSMEVGAFLAGISLASTPYRDSIGGRLVSVRDFLLLFFFIQLGQQLDMGMVGKQIVPAILLSFFVLIGNPMIVMVIMGMLGYKKRTGFLAGLTVAQISEFSLILGALGLSLGHINHDAMGIITLVGIITIGLSTYLILYSHKIYDKLAPMLDIFERKYAYREEMDISNLPANIEVIVFGIGRYGSHIANKLADHGIPILGVDFDPHLVKEWYRKNKNVQYGDVEDPEFHATLPLHKAKFVISTLPDIETNLIIMSSLREQHFKGRIALTAHNRKDAEKLREKGADMVLLPFEVAAEHVAEIFLEQIKADTGKKEVPMSGR